MATGASSRVTTADSTACPPCESPGPRPDALSTALPAPRDAASNPAGGARRQCSKAMLDALLYFMQVRAVLLRMACNACGKRVLCAADRRHQPAAAAPCVRARALAHTSAGCHPELLFQ